MQIKTYLVLAVETAACVTQHMTNLDWQAVPRDNVHHGVTTLTTHQHNIT